MEKTIRCKKCNTEFTTNIISYTKTEQRIMKNEYKIFEVTKTIERPQFTKCELCRNIQSLMNFVNEMI